MNLWVLLPVILGGGFVAAIAWGRTEELRCGHRQKLSAALVSVTGLAFGAGLAWAALQ